MYKKIIFVILAFVLLCVGNAFGQNGSVFEAEEAVIMYGDDVAAVKYDDDSAYVILNADGEVIAETEYTELENEYNEPYFIVSSEEGKTGLLNARGEECVPAVYDKVEFLSPKWVAGLIFGEGTENDYQYFDLRDNYYVIEKADLYFEGHPAGSLNKEDIQRFHDPHGDYLFVLDRNGNDVWYNSALEKSPMEDPDSVEYTSEFLKEADTYVFYHNGTGQKAFDSGCTLTADEVENPYLYLRGSVYDLQGNQLFTLPYKLDRDYFDFDFVSGYYAAKTESDSGMYKYIIFDKNGNILMEPSDFCYSLELDPVLAEEGYAILRKDSNNSAFIDLNGNFVTDFIEANPYYNYLQISNSDGSYTVYGPHGKMPGNYSYIAQRTAKALVVRDADKRNGAVNLYGEMLIPFSDDIREIILNDAATAALVRYSGDKYEIIKLDPLAE